MKESVKESVEEKKKEKEKEKEKPNTETIKTENLQDNIPVEKSKIFNAVSVPKEVKIRNEVGKSDLIKLSELKEVTYLICSNFKSFFVTIAYGLCIFSGISIIWL